MNIRSIGTTRYSNNRERFIRLVTQRTLWFCSVLEVGRHFIWRLQRAVWSLAFQGITRCRTPHYFHVFDALGLGRLRCAACARDRLQGRQCHKRRPYTIANESVHTMISLAVSANDSAPLTFDLSSQPSRGVRCGGVVRPPRVIGAENI